MMKPELLNVLAYTSGLLRMGIPLVPAWETILKDETHPAARAFAEKLIENWMNLPLNMPLRINPSIEQFFSPEEQTILRPMTYVGEATGTLDHQWSAAIALFILKNRKQLSSSDVELIQSCRYVFGEHVPSWMEVLPHGEPAYDHERLSRWFQVNRKRDVSLPPGIRAKLKETGEAAAMPDQVELTETFLKNILGSF